MLLRNCAFLGLLLLITTQVQSLNYLDDVIARVRDHEQDYVSKQTAPIFKSEGMIVDRGNLSKDNFPSMSKNVKIAMAAVHLQLLKAYNGSATPTYDDILHKMVGNPVLSPDMNSPITSRSMSYSQDTGMKELYDWYKTLISGPDFFVQTHVCPLTLAKLTKLLMVGCVYAKKPLIDLSVLQYPQADGEIFVLNHVTVNSWDNCNGISGDYTSKKFTPRTSVILGMNATTIVKAVSLIEGVFDKVAPKKEPTPCVVPSSSGRSSGNPSTVIMSTVVALLTAAMVTKTSQ